MDAREFEQLMNGRIQPTGSDRPTLTEPSQGLVSMPLFDALDAGGRRLKKVPS